jgi:hypothetical protein
LRQAVQRIVDVLNGLSLAVGLAGQIANRVIGVGFVEAGGERGLRDAAESIVGEICSVAVGVGDAQQIIFRVVAVGGDVAGGVGDGG